MRIDKIASYLSPTLITLAVVSLSGCAIARKVMIRPGEGGTVAIPYSEAPRSEANSIMEKVCGEKRVRIVQESEFITGTTTKEDVTAVAKSDFPTRRDEAVLGHREKQRINKTEWRIDFSCE